jgi:hypothetical protein
MPAELGSGTGKMPLFAPLHWDLYKIKKLAWQARLKNRLRQTLDPKENHGLYKKWLRYYLDFCEKYKLPARQKESLPGFLGKLQ